MTEETEIKLNDEDFARIYLSNKNRKIYNPSFFKYKPKKVEEAAEDVVTRRKQIENKGLEQDIIMKEDTLKKLFNLAKYSFN